MHRQELDLSTKILGAEHPDTLMSMNNLALVQMELGQLNEAEQSLNGALTIEESVHGQNHPDVAAVLDSFSDLYKKQNKAEASAKAADRARQIRRTSQGS